jgi:DNA-binding response OmpR family regulator
MKMASMIESCVKRIIIVEGDSDFRESLEKYLQTKGFEVTALGSAIEVYDVIRKQDYDLAIIDPCLSDQDGMVISSYLSSNTNTRIVMISERSSIDDKLRGYESGACIYLVKPVDLRELASAVSALIQGNHSYHREAKEKPSDTHNGKWTLKINEWTLVTPEDQGILLTAKEYMLLECLAKESQGGVVSRGKLLDILDYQKNRYGNHSLESLVYRLRRKISPTLETPIRTVNAMGYSFIAKIEVC